ncbi:hypothetical protein ACSBR2_028644 [Camellia fascicularis]
MGTREVYEEKLRSGNLYHDPTMNPGLGSPRCPRCLSLLNPNVDNGEWTITSVLHDATAVAGSGIGGMLSAIHGFNTVLFCGSSLSHSNCTVFSLPFVALFLGQLPPLLMFSAASVAFGEGTTQQPSSFGCGVTNGSKTTGNHLPSWSS